MSRIIYKELMPGDYRKLAAESNDAETGGGARDLRFPYREFDGIFARLLPLSRIERRVRRGSRIEVAVRTGPAYVYEETESGPRTTQAEMVWESPTDSRPTEGRIAKVHASPATRQLLAARDEAKSEEGPPPRVFVLFIQNDSGELGVHYAFEDDLRTPGLWADVVARPMLTHLDDVHRHRHRAVTGYIDFTTNVHYAHDLH